MATDKEISKWIARYQELIGEEIGAEKVKEILAKSYKEVTGRNLEDDYGKESQRGCATQYCSNDCHLLMLACASYPCG